MSEWIPVSEKLPEVGNMKNPKLAWLVYDGEEIDMTTIHPSWWNIETKAGDYTKVTHWMPLPEPPKGVG